MEDRLLRRSLPERIQPGGQGVTVTKIVKVVSGDTPETLATVTEIYGSVITAGVLPASCIKAAEAKKVIENTQRDLNIALMNVNRDHFRQDRHRHPRSIAGGRDQMGTSGPFCSGLVGGHCIGVFQPQHDLTHKAQKLGDHPEVILAGRRINDGMGKFIAEQTIKQLVRNGHPVKDRPIIVLGLTFKEDCPDLRNSKVIDVVRELESTEPVSLCMTELPMWRK